MLAPNSTCTKEVSFTLVQAIIPLIQIYSPGTIHMSQNTIIHPDQYKYTVHYKYIAPIQTHMSENIIQNPSNAIKSPSK